MNASANEEPRTQTKERTTSVLFVRVTKAEWLAAHAAAKLANQSIQSWTRSQLGLTSRRGYSYRSSTEPSRKLNDAPPPASQTRDANNSQHAGQGASSTGGGD